MRNATQGQKLVALLLSGWSVPDRQWALSQLPTQEQSVVARLLAQIAGIAIPTMTVQELNALSANRAHCSSRGGEIAPLLPLLEGLTPRWAARLLEAWEVSSTEAPALLDDASKAESVACEMDKLNRPLPPRLAASLREISTRLANRLLPIDARNARHGQV